MADEPTVRVTVNLPISMGEKIKALIDSENQFAPTGPVSVSDWVMWAAAYCIEKQTRAIYAFRRTTFVCDGCGASLRYTALAGSILRGRERMCYCGDCWPTLKQKPINSPIEPKAKAG